MKRIFYLLSLTVLTSGAGIAQSVNLSPAKQAKTIGSDQVQTDKVTLPTGQAKGIAVWSDDFSDPSNWAFSNTSTPNPLDWSIITDIDASPVPALSPIQLETAANGFAFINGDPEGDGSVQNANLTMVNSVDLTNFEAVTLSFFQVTRNFATTYSVRVSPDNGASWVSFEVNEDLNGNTNTGNPEEYRLDISDVAGGQGEVLIEFNFFADWGWFWAIDDISIVESPDNDIRLLSGFYDAWPVIVSEIGATLSDEQDIELVDNYEYSSYRTGQVRPLTFVGEVINQGGVAQTNVVLEVVFTGPDNVDEVFTSAPIPSFETGITQFVTIPDVMPTAFADGGTTGAYTVSFSVSSDEVDAAPGNNFVPSKSFSVNTEYMANDIGDTWSSYYPTLGADVIWGNRFTLVEDQEFNFVQFAVVNATQGPTLADEVLTLNVRTGSVFADDGAPSLLFGEDEISYVTEASEISQGVDIIWITSFFPNDQALAFSSGEIFQAEVHVPAGEAPGIAWVPLSANLDELAGALYDYADEAWFSLPGIVPLIRLGSSLGVGVEGPSDLDFKLSQNYPNPTTGNTRIDWELMVPAKNVRFSITDVTGKTVYAKDLGDRPAGVQESMELDLNLAAGNYQYGLTIGNQRIVRKMVVVK